MSEAGVPVRAAGAVVFRDFAGGVEFLLIRDGHGNWGLPKGHAEADEAPLETAQREVAEETGLTRLQWQGEVARESWSYPSEGVRLEKSCSYFLARLMEPENLVLQTDEGISDSEWLSFQNAVNRATFDTVKRTIARAVEHLAASDGGEG